MKSVMIVVGARPQLIKLFPLSLALAQQPTLKQIIIHTNQHYDYEMSGQFFKELNIPSPDVVLKPDYSNNVAFISSVSNQVEQQITKTQPDALLVFGDTNSTLAGAIAANKTRIPLIHVEAGLRSNDRNMQEENNRVITDHLSDVLFCSSDSGKLNLEKENIIDSFSNRRVFVSGDLMFDALLHFKKKSQPTNLLSTLPKDFVLLTLHREASVDHENILTSIINTISSSLYQTKIVFPLHPRTLQKIKAFNITLPPNFIIIPPQSYSDIIQLLDACRFVLTDSGGLQKEAYFSEKLCITLRNETEWTELVDIQANYLVGSDKNKMKMAIKDCINRNYLLYDTPSIYGDGNSAKIISEKIAEYLN